MADKISMADLLASNLAIDWYESVSLVREVCAVLISERVQDSTPDLGQILLAGNGTITITGTSHGDAPVRRLGQLLQALMRTTEPPVTLRLVLSEAMATPPMYGSLTELDAALAYFERPDRVAVLKALYQRASKAEMSSAPAVTSLEELETVAVAPTVVARTSEATRPDPTPKKTAAKAPSRRELVLVVGSVVMIVVAAVAFERGHFFKTATERATSAVDKAVLNTMSAVSETAGMGKLIEPGATGEFPAPVPAPASLLRHPSPHTAPVTLAGVPVKLFDLQPTREVESAVMSPELATQEALDASASPRRVMDVKVYGPDDRSVDAPSAIRPHLPTALPTGVDASQLARIELIVAADGVVESVKLVPGTAPIEVTEAMLLSAAKAWRFTPATKDGEPVRYRKTVFLSEK